MNRWSILGAAIFGAAYALFAFGPAVLTGSASVRWMAAAFIVATYWLVVVLGASGKKRSLSLVAQTSLGALAACSIAAIFRAGSDGYMLAVVAGLLLGSTADLWAKHMRLPIDVDAA